MSIDNVTRSPLPGLILLLALAALPVPASAAHSDVAPLPDDVVARLTAPVKAERNRDVTAARASVAALLQAIDALERDSSAEPSTPADRAALRAQRHQLGRTKTELLSRGLPELPRTVLAARFRRLDGLLSDVEAAENAAQRREAIARLRHVLERWLEAGRDAPAEAAPANPTFRPLGPLIAPRPPRAGALPAHAAYPADEHGVLLASLGQVALAPPPTPAEATSCSFQPADLARTQEEVDFVKHAPLRALAETLGYDPVRIYQHVANTIRYEPYFGSVKGAIGALETGAGNAHDQASLLIALLRASNVPARYVFGLAEVVDPIPMGQEGRLARWLGVKDYPAVEAVMRGSGLLQESVQNASGATVGMRFIHVWVEACLPYGSYRGARIDGSGHRWVPLDPSFKDSTYQPGIAHAATFDLAGFLAKRTNGPDSLPHEAYSERVETAIRALPPRFANNSLAEVPYSGKIFERRFDVLPVTLPYRVVDFYQFDPPANPAAEVAALPEMHRVKLKVRVRRPDGTVLLEHSLRMVEVTRARVTLAFKGLSAADRDTIDGWRAGESLAASAEPACSVQVTPTLRVEGVEVKAGTLGTDFCSTTLKLDLELDVDALACRDAAGNPLSGCLNRTAFSNIEAGNLYALLAFGYHTSNTLLAARAARLIAAVRTTANPNDDLESTEGEFLHLVGLKYLRYLSDAAVRSAELTGSLGRNGMHLGVTTARSKIAYIFDLPFAISRTGFLIDVPGGRFTALDLATGASKWDAFVLGARTGSAYESYVWQENAKLDAVSTIRGLQFAKETGVGLLTVTKANWSTQRPTLAAAYPSLLADLDRMVNQDLATLTIPTKAIKYDNWTGVVYMAESQSNAYGTYAISGGYSGGYTTNPITWSYSPALDSGYNFVSPPPAPSFTSIVNFAAPPPVVNSAINFGASPYSTYSGDPVNMVTGNMYHGETDLSIPGRGGMSMVLQRSYNSRKPQDGPFGFGWTHSFNHYLEFRTDDYDITPGEAADKDNLTSTVVWVDGSGGEKYIAVTGVLATAAGVPQNTTLVSPAGYFFTADKLPDGSWTIKERNGLTYTFEIAAGTVGQRARLARIADRNGNALMLEYDAAGNLARVKDSLDRALQFSYEPGAARISEVSDWTGRRWQYAYDTAGNLVSTWRPGLERTDTPSVDYAYLTAAEGDNLDHAMSRYTFARGNGMHFEYYANGRVFRHRTTLGETMSFSYNDFRRETIQVNERGHERRFFFNKDGMLVKLIEENGATREFAYGTGKLLFSLSKSTDPRGNVTTLTYTTTWDLWTTTLPSALTLARSQYNAFGAPGMIKDARGLYTLYKYDAKGNLLHEIRLKAGIGASVTASSYAPVATQIAAWTVFTYDAHGNLLTSRRVRDIARQISAPATITGPTVEYAYDADKLYRAGITRKGDKDGNGIVDALDTPDTAVLGHDTLGRLRQGIDSRWEVTRFEYDDADRLLSAQDASGNVQRYTYDPNGNLESEKLFATADGSETIVDSVRHEYDLSDRRIKTTANDGGVTSFEFDAAGNVVRTTDPDGYSTTIGYDELNRALWAADQEGNRVSKQLDIDGRPLSVTDPNGFTVRYEYYDKAKDLRVKRVTQPRAAGFPGGRAVEYDYDANGQVTKTSVLPADGGAARISLATYNELGLPTRAVGPVVTDPALGKIRPVTRTTYNALGYVTKVDAGRTAAAGTDTTTDVVTVQATYTWDDFGRKLKQADAAGKVWSYAYDTTGNLRRIVDPNGHVTEQTFQPGGRLEMRETKSGGTILFAAVSYQRNALGQPLSVTSSNPAYTQSFEYDGGHRLTRVEDSRGGKALHYEYSPGGRLDAMHDSDGARTDYLYDPVGRLIGISAPSSDYFAFGYDRGGRLAERWAPNGVHSEYAYNDDGTLASIRHSVGGQERAQHGYTYDAWGNRTKHAEALLGSEIEHPFVYDELDRLIQEQGAAGPLKYRYDILGNRTRVTLPDNTYSTYVYDTLNQLQRIDDYNAANVKQRTSASFTYDLAGNLLTRAQATLSQTLIWDPANQLASVTTLRTAGSTSSESLETYAYDHQGRRIARAIGVQTTDWLYNGPDIYTEHRGDWSQAIERHTHGPATDDPLLVENGIGKFYYHPDGRGSQSLLTDEAASGWVLRRYSAWGGIAEAREAGAAFTPRYGYTGREQDETTGLMYYRARYYDPAAGRFISRDPIGIAGGMNLYAYAGNNPVSFTDPEGTLPQLPALAQNTYYEASAAHSNWSLSGFLLPYTAAMGERGTPGTWGDFTAGYGKAAFNTGLGLVGSLPTPASILTPLVPRMSLADTQLSGAATYEVGSWIGGALGVRPIAGLLKPASSVPAQLLAGQTFEARQLQALNVSKNTDVWRPTAQQVNSAAFEVIVGQPKSTPTGQLVGTALDSTQGGLLELKGGGSVLDSSYQLRLQVYRSLVEETSLTLQTTRPVNPTFLDYLNRWGTTVKSLR